MFISIPKEFFIPVLFNEKFELNLINNNMEYDTSDLNRKCATHKIVDNEVLDEITEESEEKEKVKKEIEMDNKSDGEILSEADEEFIHSLSAGKGD
ncbi:MAG: hypothetical protein ACRDA5_11450 [Clostridium sp.]